MWPSALLIVLATLVASSPCHAQDHSTNKQGGETGFSIWQRGWYEERGVELPRRFGVTLNFVSMERDIEVTDVTVKVGNRPPESISDRASFDVSNRTTLELGGSLSLNRRWEFLVEVGSNFDDAFLTVFSGSYRF